MVIRVDNDFFVSSVRSDEGFCAWYVGSFMQAHLPEQYYSISDEGKYEMVLNGRRYAQARGLEDPQSQAHFITLMWQIGANFFLQPGFEEIFADVTLISTQKIDRCYKVPKDQGVNAVMNADAVYWYPEMVARRKEMTE